MTRRDFLTKAGITTAGSVLVAQLAGSSKVAMGSVQDSVQIPDKVWKDIQKIMGYSDKEWDKFKQQPRTKKIISQFEGLSQASVLFEVKKSNGCICGHRKGDFFLFRNGGALDMENSTKKLCPFLMPPMARAMWIVQERVWEGLDPLPVYPAGHCDDVGLDCNGWGRVVIEARIVEPAELASMVNNR